VSRRTDIPNAAGGQQGDEKGLFLRLGIRSSLLLGFGAMTGVVLLAVLGALYFSARVNSSVSEILHSQLPLTMGTYRVARAADALAASGLSLATLATEKERDVAFRQIGSAVHALESALEDLRRTGPAVRQEPAGLFEDLTRNLEKMQDIVDERIRLKGLQSEARKRLLSNQLAFQQQLAYRVRIIEGDGDVARRLLQKSPPPLEQVADVVAEMVHLLPVARFYSDIEFINGRLLAASQDPTLAALQTSRKVLHASLAGLKDIMGNLPPPLQTTLAQHFAGLQGLILGENGLVVLRQRELLHFEELQQLNRTNQEILQRVNLATAEMVNRVQGELDRTGDELGLMRQQSMFILALVAGLGLAGVALLMHFYVNRQIVSRLAWLSAAMQNLAAGRLDTPLPPAGSNELGRLGAALQQFRSTAEEARERENALQASNALAEQAMEELEAKTAELERANTKLTELSVRDPLTGLFNRRRLDEALELEWARAGHGGKAIALIILDVDHFKVFNDSYGHQAGDACLQKLATVFMNHARRAGDIAARYGGEEFCMICPYTDMESAGVLAQSIHRTVLALALAHAGSPFGAVTVSIGYAAAVPDGKCTAAELLQAADSALYAAKAAGRNCIRGAAPSCSPPADTLSPAADV